ncbi:hypothetical protein SARC_09180 [Sphaeroforma arctica JP610]|uniref:Uncharacterized protein n=1 Tax=Sphaeroforma arctica JP610 TaxID=667725 RepID=A0A0L0FPE2_9EUKA|nr:hypothetical protein SARC_09180 [Sphaeroforma arctica JP610]KNC78386.1 hypothetical protein SARC_09180 [Sphaeroforma arctica JP610]|eukprot:XP_014152288.1 hypothetical protein SARC_09180 [Sphaeroforma arctica JP610]
MTRMLFSDVLRDSAGRNLPRKPIAHSEPSTNETSADKKTRRVAERKLHAETVAQTTAPASALRLTGSNHAPNRVKLILTTVLPCKLSKEA